MHRWDNKKKDVWYSKLINKTLQKVIDYENNKKTGNTQKIGRKVREECRSPLNYKLFSENFLYDPLKVVNFKTLKLSILG